MERLAEKFTGTGEVKGVQFRQLFRQLFRYNDLCFYERTEIGGSLSYEVVKARYKKGGIFTIGGVQVEFKDKERYPSGNSWGLYEWHSQNIDTAIEYYNKQAVMMKYDITISKSNICHAETLKPLILL